MKHLILLFYSCFISFAARAQAPGIQWQRIYGSSDGDGPKAIRATPDGGFIAAGISYGNDQDVSGHNATSFFSDAWVVKLNSSGAIGWQRSLGGGLTDQAADIWPTPDNGYMLFGSTSSYDCGMPGTKGGSDYWLAKLDAEGNILWERTYGGSNEEQAKSLCPTPDGGYILAGTALSADGDVTGHHGNGSGDYWFLKVNASGDPEWNLATGGSSVEWLLQAVATRDGGCIAAGYAESSNGDLTGNKGSLDAWIVKISPGGTIAWQKNLGSSGGDQARSILQTPDDGYVFAGYASENDGDLAGILPSPGREEDYWIVRLDAAGNVLWQRTYGGFSSDIANSVVITSDGGFVVAGYSASSNEDFTCNNGGLDTWIIKLNTAGVLQWQRNIGGNNNDAPEQIIQTTDGNLLAAITTCSTDIPGYHSSATTHCQDMLIVKLSGGGAPLPGPSLTIEPVSGSICGETINTFRASASNMSATVRYQWTKNGSPVGTNHPVYQANDIVTGDMISCTATDPSGCDNAGQATATITTTAKTILQPSINIYSSSQVACNCKPISFSATVTGGGSNPVYEWRINGKKTGATTQHFIVSNIYTGDIVTCVYRDNSGCIANGEVISNAITMSTTQTQTITASITPSTNNICQGMNVGFTVTAIDPDLQPSYQWMINNNTAGTDSPSFWYSSLTNGDRVTCVITLAPGPCGSIPFTTDPVSVTVRPKTTPSILISSTSTNNEFCPGVPASFRALYANAGDNPLFQWMINGVNATGGNDAIFNTTALQNGDQVSCILMVDPAFAECATVPSVASTSITASIINRPAPVISISADKPAICQGETLSFSAAFSNAGTDPVMQWLVDGVIRGNGSGFSTNSLMNGSTVQCTLEPGAGACNIPLVSNTIIPVIHPRATVSIQPADTIIKPGTKAFLKVQAGPAPLTYQWSPASQLETPATGSSYTTALDKTVHYTLTVRTPNGCIASASNLVSVSGPFLMPSAFTPNRDGLNDLFIIPAHASIELEEFSIFDRWGIRIFSTKDIGKGWDGTVQGVPVESGAFVYLIRGKNNEGSIALKGTVTLVR
ncbi:gliding motility-associated C-terminal domain-containing protein [Terrimonas sp. NA20]|uniref:Gliding motility-associated C-terminal domain-containing protein n=1 Tax=Terrimonas ginsenosidimutans TaxID=2908004 RepID=A0ABS9KVC3_9BACT|nr:T9SS type B sorting domain-containing protein [Terrimonas ginsenosidimutans]MCG2616243.1 gliding motility-associated C-terminal domain-containing protein [Terrimonas ginsenosidimutans]